MARFGYLRVALFSFVCLPALAFTVQAQSPTPTPQVVMPAPQQQQRVASQSSLYCAGYIRYQRLPQMPEIVGAEEEQEQRTYADGDIVYLNAGSQQGIKEGQNFQIIRPRGDVKGVHKQKRGFLGTYIQKISRLQVFKVRENTSAAQITFTCDAALLGDLLAPVPDRDSPLQRAEENLDRFVDLRLVPDETAQLHFALFGFNHDIAALDVGIRQQRSLYLGRDDAVVDNGSSRRSSAWPGRAGKRRRPGWRRDQAGQPLGQRAPDP